jgi:serine/threonine protein kinase/tetratricopeptide (TPR) repeat protein
VSDNNQTRSHEQSLYEAALHLKTPEERQAFLNAACAKDPELRRWIEELLSAAAEAEGFFDQDPMKNAGLEGRGLLAAAPEVPVTEKPGERIGRYKLLQKIGEGGLVPPESREGLGLVQEQVPERIGRYKLLQRIGEGGCGVVYMAEQEEPVRRRVALKVIKLGMDTRSVVARFEAERQALALMDHPNIAKVLDAGATETGRPYFVMELVRGVKITDYCDEKNLSTKERLELFVKVCQAVQHAHQKGIIHRDLKPSNVLVSVNDGVAVPKVIDFGVAKATTDQRLTDKTVFTAFEQFIGTPAYMSPEQAEITSVDVDTRSDIYSLGVLLYELLTGQTPFDARELLKAGLDEMRRTIREKEPDRPSTRVSTLGGEELTTTAKRRGLEAPKLVNVLRGDLDWIVMKCLEKDRARRYETANGLAMDVQRHLSNEPVVACPPSNLYRLHKLVRRNRLAFAAAGGVFAALVIGLAVALWQSGEKTRAYRRAVAAEKEARTQATRSERVAQLLNSMLQGAGPEVAKGRDATILLEILQKATERIGKELAQEPEVEADVRINIGDVYFDLGHYEEAETVVRRALVVLREMRPRDELIEARALNTLAKIVEARGKQAEAESMNREALEVTRRILGNADRETGMTLGDLGCKLMGEGKFVEAEAALRESTDILRKLFGDDNREVIAAEGDLAGVLEAEGKSGEAETLFRHCLERLRRVQGAVHPDVATALYCLGNCLVKHDKLDEAEPLLQEALAMRQKLLGSGHPDVGRVLNEQAMLANKRGKSKEAETLLRQVLAIYRTSLGEVHPEVATALHNLAVQLQDQGKLGEAETLMRQALEIRTNHFGKENYFVAWSLRGLAQILGGEGKYAEAEPLLREALATFRKTVGNDHPEVAATIPDLAGLLEREGKSAEAEGLFREAIALRGKLADSLVALTLLALADLQAKQGEPAKAEGLYRQTLELRASIPPETVASTLNRLAILVAKQGNAAEAERLYRQTLKLRGKAPDEEVAMALNNLADVLSGQGKGKVAEAESLAREGLAMAPKTPLAARHVGDCMCNLADILVRQNKLDEAERVLSEPLDLRAQASGALVLQRRGELRARRTRWNEAAADLGRALELNPTDHLRWHSLAAVLVEQGDSAAYREHCRRSLERFRNTTDPKAAHRVAKDCLVVPASGVELDAVTAMAGLWLTATNNIQIVGAFPSTKGLAEYREGRYLSAVEWSDKALLIAMHEAAWARVQTYAVLAMAQWKLNRIEPAKESLAQGATIARTELPKLETGDLGPGWLDWIFAHALLREATELIDGRKPDEIAQSPGADPQNRVEAGAQGTNAVQETGHR